MSCRFEISTFVIKKVLYKFLPLQKMLGYFYLHYQLILCIFLHFYGRPIQLYRQLTLFRCKLEKLQGYFVQLRRAGRLFYCAGCRRQCSGFCQLYTLRVFRSKRSTSLSTGDVQQPLQKKSHFKSRCMRRERRHPTTTAYRQWPLQTDQLWRSFDLLTAVLQQCNFVCLILTVL